MKYSLCIYQIFFVYRLEFSTPFYLEYSRQEKTCSIFCVSVPQMCRHVASICRGFQRRSNKSWNDEIYIICDYIASVKVFSLSFLFAWMCVYACKSPMQCAASHYRSQHGKFMRRLRVVVFIDCNHVKLTFGESGMKIMLNNTFSRNSSSCTKKRIEEKCYQAFDILCYSFIYTRDCMKYLPAKIHTIVRGIQCQEITCSYIITETTWYLTITRVSHNDL